MKVYLAGQMRGLPGWGFAAFDSARKAWTAAGHTVFCPAALARALPWGQHEGTETPRDHLLHVAQLDLACLYAADAIALLPGWEQSRGATMELAVAQFLGLPVYDALTMVRIVPAYTPWRCAQSDPHYMPWLPPGNQTVQSYTPSKSACPTCAGEREITMISPGLGGEFHAVPCPTCNPCQHKLGYNAAGGCRVCGEKWPLVRHLRQP
jgi:hypothetical protein